MTDFNYEEDTAIDPDRLLEEWLELPNTFYEYSAALSQKEREVNTTWEALKTVRSKLVLEAKTENGLNNPKATAGEVEAYYRTQPEYQEAKERLINMEYERDMIQNAVSAFFRKEKALHSVQELHKMEWWRGPKQPLELPSGKRIKDRLKSPPSSVEKRRETNKRRRRKANG